MSAALPADPGLHLRRAQLHPGVPRPGGRGVALPPAQAASLDVSPRTCTLTCTSILNIDIYLKYDRLLRFPSTLQAYIYLHSTYYSRY